MTADWSQNVPEDFCAEPEDLHMWGDGETAVLVDPCLGLGI